MGNEVLSEAFGTELISLIKSLTTGCTCECATGTGNYRSVVCIAFVNYFNPIWASQIYYFGMIGKGSFLVQFDKKT